jgi:nucleotide-binding universal stress UspA family protein
LEHGHPGVRIGEVADEEDVDLVVIGQQGANRAKGLYWGKVSEQVSHSTSCSIMIVK